MKKKISTFVVLLACAMTFASTGEKPTTKTKISDLKGDPCTVTVTKRCDAAGKDVTSSATSSIGNCNEAYQAANEGWPAACLEEGIKKVIMEEAKKNFIDKAK